MYIKLDVLFHLFIFKYYRGRNSPILFDWYTIRLNFLNYNSRHDCYHQTFSSSEVSQSNQINKVAHFCVFCIHVWRLWFDRQKMIHENKCNLKRDSSGSLELKRELFEFCNKICKRIECWSNSLIPVVTSSRENMDSNMSMIVCFSLYSYKVQLQSTVKRLHLNLQYCWSLFDK